MKVGVRNIGHVAVVDLAGKIIRAQLKPEDHANLIKDALANFPKGNPGNN